MTFLVLDTPSPYNGIVGRPGLNLMEATVSIRHLVMKFPMRFGVGEVRGDQQAARQCYKAAVMDKRKEKILPIANVELIGDVDPERLTRRHWPARDSHARRRSAAKVAYGAPEHEDHESGAHWVWPKRPR
ncbi:hypothetical protein CFOL_v3_35028 [Cephalotus follicularis]|uniref:Uncharacterized protein n=1 Tax=Cephalotus follicularis TaxID=3775 RepID=A0A1Q3DHC1_CEPFO|nr:hypothetical protein CFOL_v3_35028 [Cephalotus follicularis]